MVLTISFSTKLYLGKELVFNTILQQAMPPRPW